MLFKASWKARLIHMIKEIRQSIENILDKFTLHNYRLHQLAYLKKYFGNVIVDIKTLEFSFRFTNDCGQFFCDICHNSFLNETYSFEEALSFIGLGIKHENGDFYNYIEEVLALVDSNYQTILSIFRIDNGKTIISSAYNPKGAFINIRRMFQNPFEFYLSCEYYKE